MVPNEIKEKKIWLGFVFSAGFQNLRNLKKILVFLNMVVLLGGGSRMFAIIAKISFIIITEKSLSNHKNTVFLSSQKWRQFFFKIISFLLLMAAI